MNTKEIEALIKFVQRSGVSEVAIEDKDFKITIKTAQRNSETHRQELSIAAPLIALPQVLSPAAATGSSAPVPASKGAPETAENTNLITIKSPMIGTFYRTPGPDKPAFVNVGDEINHGKVICIIEAMKLFNEIESEVNGKIVKVLVDNATPIEYDQPLFLVEPN